jgi:hypothetical protein
MTATKPATPTDARARVLIDRSRSRLARLARALCHPAALVLAAAAAVLVLIALAHQPVELACPVPAAAPIAAEHHTARQCVMFCDAPPSTAAAAIGAALDFAAEH